MFKKWVYVFFSALLISCLASANEKKLIIVSTMEEALAKPGAEATPKPKAKSPCTLYLSNPAPYLQSFIADFALTHTDSWLATAKLLHELSTGAIRVNIDANLNQPFFFHLENSPLQIAIAPSVVQHLLKHYLESDFTLSTTGRPKAPAIFRQSLLMQLARYEVLSQYQNGSLAAADLNVWTVEEKFLSWLSEGPLSEKEIAARAFAYYQEPKNVAQNTLLLMGSDLDKVAVDLSALEEGNQPSLLFDLPTYFDLAHGKTSLQNAVGTQALALTPQTTENLILKLDLKEGRFEAPMKELRVRFAELLFARKFFKEAKEERNGKKTLEAASLLFQAEWRFQEIYDLLKSSLLSKK